MKTNKNNMFSKSIAVAIICLFIPASFISNVNSHISYSLTTPTFTNFDKSIISYDEDIIVYTANQGFISRIYLLNMSGSVLNYYEYVNFHFCDMEIVNNDLYVSEAFAPRVEKVTLETGELEVIVDDWSLYYFYDLAFDGMYFYVDEWDLNRYDINGNKEGIANINETVFGSTWDGNFLWTLVDSNIIKCWNISDWPNVSEVPDNGFNPPSPSCRGLWFDGKYFWTAESIDGNLGYIYRFKYNGAIINQWIEPAYRGWSACVIKGDNTSLEILTVLNYKWNFISLPLNQSINKTDLIIHYNGTDYNWTEAIDPANGPLVDSFIFGWNRGLGGQTYQAIDTLEPGYGYWLYAYEDCEPWTQNISATTNDFITNIGQKWNTMGIPFDQSVDKTNLTLQYNGTDYNWTEATDPANCPIIDSFIFGWNRGLSGQTYQAVDVLEPGYSYWMYAYYDCTMKKS
jgi:hypothetical protein